MIWGLIISLLTVAIVGTSMGAGGRYSVPVVSPLGELFVLLFPVNLTEFIIRYLLIWYRTSSRSSQLIAELTCYRCILYSSRPASHDTELSGNYYAISLAFLQSIDCSPRSTHSDRTQSAVDLVSHSWTLLVPNDPYRLHGIRKGDCRPHALQGKHRR